MTRLGQLQLGNSAKLFVTQSHLISPSPFVPLRFLTGNEIFFFLMLIQLNGEKLSSPDLWKSSLQALESADQGGVCSR